MSPLEDLSFRDRGLAGDASPCRGRRDPMQPATASKFQECDVARYLLAG